MLGQEPGQVSTRQLNQGALYDFAVNGISDPAFDTRLVWILCANNRSHTQCLVLYQR